MRRIRLATFLTLTVFFSLSLSLSACDVTTADPKLPPYPGAIPQRHGENPDLDLNLKAQDAMTSSESTWSAAGYLKALYGWRLPYDDAAKHRLAPEPWRLANWTEKSPGQFEPKLGADDVATFEVDDNGDGKIEGWEKHEEPLFDLEFVNEEDDSLVWIKTRSIAPTAARRRLDLVARDYLESLSGTGTFSQLDIFGRERARTRRLTTLVRDVRETHLGGHRAIAASADIADADDLRLNPKARLGQLRLVVARIGYLAPKTSRDDSSAWPVAGSTVKKTAVLVVGAFTSIDDSGNGKGSLLESVAGRLAFTPTSIVVEAPRPPEPPKPDGKGGSEI
jgi:hypothetical protein